MASGALGTPSRIVDLLCCAGRQDEAVLLEGWWNALLEREPASLLCAIASRASRTRIRRSWLAALS